MPINRNKKAAIARNKVLQKAQQQEAAAVRAAKIAVNSAPVTSATLSADYVVPADGNCLYHAVLSTYHARAATLNEITAVRNQVADYLSKNKVVDVYNQIEAAIANEDYAGFDEEFVNHLKAAKQADDKRSDYIHQHKLIDGYIQGVRKNFWGGELEISALAAILPDVKIEVYRDHNPNDNEEPKLFRSYGNGNRTIKIWYNGFNHYETYEAGKKRAEYTYDLNRFFNASTEKARASNKEKFYFSTQDNEDFKQTIDFINKNHTDFNKEKGIFLEGNVKVATEKRSDDGFTYSVEANAGRRIIAVPNKNPDGSLSKESYTVLTFNGQELISVTTTDKDLTTSQVSKKWLDELGVGKDKAPASAAEMQAGLAAAQPQQTATNKQSTHLDNLIKQRQQTAQRRNSIHTV